MRLQKRVLGCCDKRPKQSKGDNRIQEHKLLHQHANSPGELFLCHCQKYSVWPWILWSSKRKRRSLEPTIRQSLADNADSRGSCIPFLYAQWLSKKMWKICCCYCNQTRRFISQDEWEFVQLGVHWPINVLSKRTERKIISLDNSFFNWTCGLWVLSSATWTIADQLKDVWHWFMKCMLLAYANASFEQ